jgi:hypothetical protein
MGHGTFAYRHRKQIWKGFLQAIEILLYAMLIATSFILLAGEGSDPRWEPDGGFVLIPILLLISSVRWLRERTRPEPNDWLREHSS